MKAVLIGEPSGASMDEIMAVYPRHKKVVDEFVDKGIVYGIGPAAVRSLPTSYPFQWATNEGNKKYLLNKKNQTINNE